MNLLALGGLCLGSGVLAWQLTLWVERKAKRLGLVQEPNHRSSHVVPTPSGGGVAIAIANVLAIIVLCLSGAPWMWPVAAGAAAIGALGFADDLHDLPAAARFPIQALVFAGLIWALGPLPPLGWLAGALLVFVVLFVALWWLNLFNFMDGIDGLAASQAILILLGGCALWWSTGEEMWGSPAFALAMICVGATSGFLVRNWPPARIFMGDAGSNALAVIICAFAMLTIADQAVSYQAWLILPSVFVTDATLTLLRRTARGERPWQAHRRHAYQQLARRWGHRRVTLLYAGLTAFWALPLALFAQHTSAWPIVALAYAPLIGFAAWARAGAAAEASV